GLVWGRVQKAQSDGPDNQPDARPRRGGAPDEEEGEHQAFLLLLTEAWREGKQLTAHGPWWGGGGGRAQVRERGGPRASFFCPRRPGGRGSSWPLPVPGRCGDGAVPPPAAAAP